MILELADIRIHPGQQAAFDEAIQRGLETVISQAKAYRQSSTVAALAAALTNGLGFALPWLIFYVM